MEAVIVALRTAFPRSEFPEDSQRFYVNALVDLDEYALMRAVRRLANRSVWLPSVAEIRRDVAEETLQLPTASEAWAIAERGNLRDAPDEVRAAAESVGGRWGIMRSENPTVVRSQFVRDYEERREKSLLAEMDAAPVAMWDPRPILPPARTIGELDPGLDATNIVMLRAVLRKVADPPPPSPVECWAAIRVLERGDEISDELYGEAERIFCEASA